LVAAPIAAAVELLAAGSSTAAAIGAATNSQAGLAAGSSTAAAIGAATNSQAGLAAGSSTANAVHIPPSPAVGVAVGSSAANAIPRQIIDTVGNAAGSSEADAVGEDAVILAGVQQSLGGSNTGVSDTSGVTWTVPTTAGNCLIACLSVSPPTTWAPPAGWLLAKDLDPGAALGRCSIYYYPDAPSHTGGEAFVPALTTSTWLLVLLEVQGIDLTSPVDQTASNSNTTLSTAIDGGTTGTTGQVYEFALCNVLMVPHPGSVSGVSSPFVALFSQAGVFGVQLMDVFNADLNSTTVVHFTCTAAIPTKWVAVTATFRLG